MGPLVVRREGQSGGAHHLPAHAGRRQRPAAFPGAGGARLAAGVGQLHAGHGARTGDEARDGRPGGHLRGVPQPGVVRGDAAARLDGGGLRHDEPRPARGPGAEVHQVPVRRHAVLSGVLAHRRDHDPVAERDAAQPQRLQECGHGESRRAPVWADGARPASANSLFELAFPCPDRVTLRERLVSRATGGPLPPRVPGPHRIEPRGGDVPWPRPCTSVTCPGARPRTT